MDVEKVFSDLESNQTQECEESKRKLVELFTQSKETWPVYYMMDYYYKTGSQRIMEVLVKVQTPHDIFIFDRVSEWLKMQTHRLQALNLLFFVVRNNPTWLFKIEKHRLIKDIFKLLMTEKDIVPLMSALLCIITLLPIIPNLVPNLLGDLFEVFGHLASWNCQNPKGLSDDKLVHLQLGLQMLFHRLYGMYPCSFMTFLSDFVKKDKGAIFHHTIKPLLETVRMHPMLVTATIESEINQVNRWKEKEPHDVVEECARLSLPMLHQDLNSDQVIPITRGLHEVPFDDHSMLEVKRNNHSKPAYNTNKFYYSSSEYLRDKQTQYPARSSNGSTWQHECDGNRNISGGAIWSPYNEITASGPMPLTPTPPYMLPLTSASTAVSKIANQVAAITGSSPPEAAVEATPETTPMKDLKELKQQHLANPHAVRAIFASQPSSPLRKENQNQFNFSDTVTDGGSGAASTMLFEQEVNTRVVTRVSTTYDRRIQQIVHDRSRSHSPFQTIESMMAKQQSAFRSPNELNSKSGTPDIDSNDMPSSNQFLGSAAPTPTPTPTPSSTQMPTPSVTPIPNIFTPSTALKPTSMSTFSTLENITKICRDCNETDHSMCTEGGLQTPTSRSMQMLIAKGIKRRNRMVSECYNDSNCMKVMLNNKQTGETEAVELKMGNLRRTKSCPAINFFAEVDNEVRKNRLQKSAKMLAIAAAKKQILDGAAVASSRNHVSTQTIEFVSQNYENSLFQMLLESVEIRHVHEQNQLQPQEILDTYVSQTIRSKDGSDRVGNLDQEQFQLICLQLQYERHRREMHAERNRRLMGRSRDKRSVEMERDRLREQVKSITFKNAELVRQIERNTKLHNDREQLYVDELTQIKLKYQSEIELNKCLRQANENLQTSLTEEQANRKGDTYELEALRGEIFNLTSELQLAQQQADMGLQCKQELARLEAEFIVMGEVQIKCRDKLSEIENFKARDEELHMLQSHYNKELKDLRHVLEEKTSQLDSAKHKINELQVQLQTSEKVITDQKRLLKTVKDEYEEKFKALNKKYDVQKTIIMQMEEKIMMSVFKPQGGVFLNACSPDTDKTDVASSMDRNSPLSTSLASSESLSASLRSSTELRNLHQLVETPTIEISGGGGNGISSVKGGANIIEGRRLPAPDLASSAMTASSSAAASAINIIASTSTAAAAAMTSTASAQTQNFESLSGKGSHIHPHVHLQQ
ncbi:hamartin [Ceratitis capitata]|uniref:Hamartin n=1 Tax=Ceratitis capitata TaxID=7213 RepID=W8CE15_CERCA|nr:hamartin [Ceratitis capitata]XP_020716317.1 hamartin [Ceratitis capitata]